MAWFANWALGEGVFDTSLIALAISGILDVTIYGIYRCIGG